MELNTIAKRWGSSIGIILPKSVVDENRIQENDEVIIEIKKRVLAKELFGKFQIASEKSTQKIKDEMRKGWG
jgi:antitoxin component of MazEF toxin-antitoxin module